MGLEYKAETKLLLTQYFQDTYHYDEGITLLEIDMTKDTERDPEKQTGDDKESEDTDTAATENTAATADEEDFGQIFRFLSAGFLESDAAAASSRRLLLR